MNELERIVADVASARATAIERAYEAAIQGGQCGVRVTNNPDGSTTAVVDSTVPYGFIYEYEIVPS